MFSTSDRLGTVDYDRVISEYRARVLPKPASEPRAHKLVKPASEPPPQRLPRIVPEADRRVSAPEQSFESLERSVENDMSHPVEVETERGVEEEKEDDESGSEELEELRLISKTSKVIIMWTLVRVGRRVLTRGHGRKTDT